MLVNALLVNLNVVPYATGQKDSRTIQTTMLIKLSRQHMS